MYGLIRKHIALHMIILVGQRNSTQDLRALLNHVLTTVVYPSSDPTSSIVVKWVKIFQAEKTIEKHLVMPTEVCGKV